MSSILQTPELAIGIGVGAAAGAAFEPKVEVPKQQAWAANPVRLPDLGLIAELVAGGKVSLDSAHNMANRLGFDNGTLDSVIWLSQNRLDFAAMLRLWRLTALPGHGTDADLAALVDETLAHERLDWGYRQYLLALKTAELPGIGDIAMGVVRSALPAPAYVPVPAPTTGLSVPRFPQVNIDPEQLAAALGYSPDMLQLMIARSGLSLAPGLAATALFRGEINDADYLLAIAEGDLRTEWAETLKNASRLIPTPGEFMENALRGWRTKAEGETGAALHGMTPDNADVLWQNKRRPLAVSNITKALARGGTFNPEAGEIQDPYSASVHQADLGPEWYDLAEHLKYTYPSAFVLRALAQAGDLGNTAAVEQILLEIGWKPDLAAKVATSWTGGATVADPHVTKAQAREWTTAQTSYINGEADAAEVQPTFAALGIPTAAQSEVLASWDRTRALQRKQLTPAQLKKVYRNADTNPATGAAWTLDEVVARLVGMGYSYNDALTFLEE